MTATPPTDVSIPTVLFGLMLLGFLATSAIAWLLFLANFKNVRNWSGWKPARPRARVGLVDLGVGFCCMVVAQFLVLGLLQPFIPKQTEPSEVPSQISDSEGQETVTPPKRALPTWVAPVLSLSFLLGGGLTLMCAMIRTGAKPSELGLAWGEWRRDVWVGLVAFLLVTPLVLIISQITIRITAVEYEHPVIDAMQDHPWTFPLLFVGAVVCAPLWEEFVFRGLLIGWFDSIRCSRGNVRTILFGSKDRVSAEPAEATSVDLPYGVLESNPYTIPDGYSSYVNTGAAEPREDPNPGLESRPPWWPAIASGVVFGLAHFGYGVSWVPLIVFGTVLGRLSQLRHSILPGVIVHACFNLISMLGLAVQILSGKG